MLTAFYAFRGKYFWVANFSEMQMWDLKKKKRNIFPFTFSVLAGLVIKLTQLKRRKSKL